MLFGRKSRAVESAAKDEDVAWRLEAIGQNVATIRFTPDGQILSANPLFLAAVGYSADELVGKHHRIFCEEDYQASAAYVRFWKELASGTPQRGVFKRLRRDGSPIWLEATYFPVKNAEGAVVEVLKIAADVTRNHSELLLLNAINDSIRQSMAVIEFTPDGEILDANENFLRLFGYSLKSLKGQHHRMLCFDEFYRENPDFWARLRHGEFSRGHFERRTAAGERVHIEATYNPVKDGSGRIIKVIKFAIDVTEQVNRNEEVRRAAELSFSTAEETAQISTRGIDSLDQSVALSAKTLSMVNTAVGLISQLTHQTKDIENIVTTIQSVAEQTNLRYLDGQPVSLIRHCYAVSRSELLADYQGGSLRRYLADKGLPLTRTYSLIGARLPNREEAARLLMPRHAPLLTVLTLSRDRTGQPVELAQSISRADRFQYQVAP